MLELFLRMWVHEKEKREAKKVRGLTWFALTDDVQNKKPSVTISLLYYIYELYFHNESTVRYQSISHVNMYNAQESLT